METAWFNPSPLFLGTWFICSSMIHHMIREKSGNHSAGSMYGESIYVSRFFFLMYILFNSLADKDGKRGSPSPQLSDGCPMPKCKQSPEMSSCLFRLKTPKTIIRSKQKLLIRVLISSQLLIAGWNWHFRNRIRFYTCWTSLPAISDWSAITTNLSSVLPRLRIFFRAAAGASPVET